MRTASRKIESKNKSPGKDDGHKVSGSKGIGRDLTRVLLGLICVGALLRIVTFWSGYNYGDTPFYVQMGRSIAQGENFILPWGDPFMRGSGPWTPVPSHHFSPLYPMLLGLFFAAFGYSYELARAVGIWFSIVFLFVIYMTTKDLMGRDKALAITAIFSVDPNLIITTRDMMPENLLMTFFALTIWAIVKAIKDDRYMVIAALGAGAGYLTKSSVGYLFILAGIGGFLWRFYYLRWDVLRRKWYLAAIAIFLSILAGWALRNIMTFGWPNWETSPYLSNSLTNTLYHPVEFLVALLVSIPFMMAMIMSYGAYFASWARDSLRKIRSERTSAFWLAFGLVVVISVWFSAAITIFEGTDLIEQASTRMRYLVILSPPLLWAVMDQVKLVQPKHRLGSSWVKGFFSEAWEGVRSLRRNPPRAVMIATLVLGAVLITLANTLYSRISFLMIGAALAAFFVDPRKVLAVMLAFFLVASLQAGTTRIERSEITLGEDLNTMVQPGQNVAFDGGATTLGYAYLRLDHYDFNMTGYEKNKTTDYIISYFLDRDYPGYSKVRVYNDTFTPGIFSLPSLYLKHQDPLESKQNIVLWKKAG